MKKQSFVNPYSWVGEGHNWVMDKFNKNEVDFTLTNSFELTKQYMRNLEIEYGDFDSRFVIAKTDELLKLVYPGFPDSLDNSKREMNSNELILYLYENRMITEDIKEHLLKMSRIIDTYDNAKTQLSGYCEGVELIIDDTTKFIIFGFLSIYNASFDFQMMKFNKKVLLPWIKADLLGFVIGVVMYGANCLVTGQPWHWGSAAVAGIAGAAFASTGLIRWRGGK